MLYTGKGDDGTTTVFGSKERILKSSTLPEALGALDELNSFIGFVRVKSPDRADMLQTVQEAVFIIQAEVAGADKKLAAQAVADIEAMIADIEKKLPPINAFTISGGTEHAALFDVLRTLARRAERRVVAVQHEHIREISPVTKAYLNRLSSLFFAHARFHNHVAGIAEQHPKY